MLSFPSDYSQMARDTPSWKYEEKTFPSETKDFEKQIKFLLMQE